jgi:hypothetical protein
MFKQSVASESPERRSRNYDGYPTFDVVIPAFRLDMGPCCETVVNILQVVDLPLAYPQGMAE